MQRAETIAPAPSPHSRRGPFWRAAPHLSHLQVRAAHAARAAPPPYVRTARATFPTPFLTAARGYKHPAGAPLHPRPARGFYSLDGVVVHPAFARAPQATTPPPLPPPRHIPIPRRTRGTFPPACDLRWACGRHAFLRTVGGGHVPAGMAGGVLRSPSLDGMVNRPTRRVLQPHPTAFSPDLSVRYSPFLGYCRGWATWTGGINATTGCKHTDLLARRGNSGRRFATTPPTFHLHLSPCGRPPSHWLWWYPNFALLLP